MNLKKLIDRLDRSEAAALDQLTRAAVACETSLAAHERATDQCTKAREKIAAAHRAAVDLTQALARHIDENPSSPRMVELYTEALARAKNAENRQQTIDQLMINAPFQN